MATSAELLTLCESAISKVLTRLAAGETVTEITEGAIRMKRESPAELLKALRSFRTELQADSDGTRQAAIICTGGVQ